MQTDSVAITCIRKAYEPGFAQVVAPGDGRHVWKMTSAASTQTPKTVPASSTIPFTLPFLQTRIDHSAVKSRVARNESKEMDGAIEEDQENRLGSGTEEPGEERNMRKRTGGAS